MDEDGELTLNMVNVELPLPHNSSEYWDYADTMFRERLLREWDVYASHYYHNNRWWTRCSAQVFSEVSVVGLKVSGSAYRYVLRHQTLNISAEHIMYCAQRYGRKLTKTVHDYGAIPLHNNQLLKLV